jgi:hypothetical protein
MGNMTDDARTSSGTGTDWKPPDSSRDEQRRARREQIERAKQLAAESNESSRSRLGRDTHRWARWLHVYASMLALLLMLFFGLTGITLNHPSWTFGDATDISTTTVTLPIDPTFADGSTDYLSISEYLRSDLGVVGRVESFDTVNGQASISYRNPGYNADAFVDTATGELTLTVEQQGWVAVINDLHKGRSADGSWKWLIDVAGAFLVVIALTGLTMQFFLRKRRTSALISAGVGIAVVVVLAYVALH